ncbi:MAG: oligosaccharide repeat unit polymerase [Limisphaerales bacterium]
MNIAFKFLTRVGWDRRVTALVLYVLVPAVIGTLTRLADLNPMLGDFAGIELRSGIVSAFFALCFYVFGTVLFFLCVAKITLRRRGDFKLRPQRVRAFGRFVLAYQIASLVFSLQSGLGVAAGSGSIDGKAKILFILLSSDFIFSLYFLITVEQSKLIWANSLTYLVSSMMRGWASGILLLLVLAYIKYPERIKRKQVVLGIVILFLAVPILLNVREVFRGSESGPAGTEALVSLAQDNIHYGDVVFVLINRFDLVPSTQTFDAYYRQLFFGLSTGDICYPWNEGIYQTVFNAMMGNTKCLAAGEALPSLIHGSFFFTRRSSFSIGAGWLYGADWLTASLFLLYVAFLLAWARFLGGALVRIPVLRAYCVFAIVFYLIPGWYFHFIQAINALLFANLFLRVGWKGTPALTAVESRCLPRT